MRNIVQRENSVNQTQEVWIEGLYRKLSESILTISKSKISWKAVLQRQEHAIDG